MEILRWRDGRWIRGVVRDGLWVYSARAVGLGGSQIGAMAALVDEDKMTHADAAKKWLADNKNVWEKWTK